MFEREQAHQFSVSGPGIAMPLTALIEPPLMYPSHLIEEPVQAGAVAIHSVVVVITTKLGIQQLHLFSDATMAVSLAPLRYAFQ